MFKGDLGNNVFAGLIVIAGSIFCVELNDWFGVFNCDANDLLSGVKEGDVIVGLANPVFMFVSIL